MELREAIEAFKARKISWRELDPDIITIILNAVEVGTLIPADAVFQVKGGYEVGAAKVDADGNLQRIAEFSEALEIRSADYVRREGFLAGIVAAADIAEFAQLKPSAGGTVGGVIVQTRVKISEAIRALAAQTGGE